jgi:cytochrome c553
MRFAALAGAVCGVLWSLTPCRLFFLPALAADQPKAAVQAPSFETDVQPILKVHCARCHGQKPRKAGLDLSRRDGVFKGGDSGPAVVAGQAEASLLYRMLHEGKMPPKKKDRLPAAKVEIIRRWIAAETAAGGRKAVAAVTESAVTPLLLLHCTVCHGGRKREAGLDLRTRASMLKGGRSGPALLPGHPEQSLLLKKVHGAEMPPFQLMMKVSVKPMAADEIEKLERWIAAGAPAAPAGPDIATTDPDPLVTDADRNFWAFRPPPPVVVPRVRDAGRVSNPVDAFILKKLEEKGLAPAAEADRLTLLRRAFVDLTGLLPEPAEVQAFLADRRPDAYERLIDRLLASPRYGERWGRYWLDVAGYADSDGHFADPVRMFGYRYRDYVIRSFNADKPYDRFLVEQIAGDELADYEHAKVITPELMDNLVATGFLRQTPDGTNPNELNYVPERLDVIADEMEVFGSAVLGLTVKCARCHDHKYDPIPTRDYYRLLAIFKGAYDEHDWLKPVYRNLPHVTAEEKQKQQAHNRPYQEQIRPLREAISASTELLRQKYREEILAKMAKPWRAGLRRLLSIPAERRTKVLKYLLGKLEQRLRLDNEGLKQRDAEFRKVADETDKKIEAFQDRMLIGGPAIRALWDRGEPSPTFIYRQGDFQKPGRLVGPGVPSVLTDGHTPFVVQPPWPGANKTGRRLALARWLTRPDHPLTARVMVNRIWKHHFGRGLVATLDNFGHTGARPTHPELLDWLAREFVHKGWSVKVVHRLLMTSRTYRQASARRPELEKADPENRLLARMPLQRKGAEALYDTLLQVSGRLDLRPFDAPDPVDVRPEGLVTPVGTPRGWRRSVYVRQRRKELPTLLDNFDFPQMTPNCIERITSTVASQALTLMNGGLVHRLAGAFAERVSAEAGPDPGRQIERAYWTALARPPTPEERAASLQALAELTQAWGKQNLPGPDPHRRALATYCHMLLNSAAFLTVD